MLKRVENDLLGLISPASGHVDTIGGCRVKRHDDYAMLLIVLGSNSMPAFDLEADDAVVAAEGTGS